MSTKKILLFSAFISTISLLVFVSFYTGYLRFNYPSYKDFPIQGIDVSHHQKNITWKKINKEKVKFVYVKATEGGDFKDKNFVYNWSEAKKNNFVVGAYHFFTFCKSGKEQAQNFIETVPKHKEDLPPVIDLEFGGNCKLLKSSEELMAEIDTIELILFKHYQKKTILYVTEEFYNKFLVGKYLDNPIWFRDIYKRPQIIDNRKWLIWQYANRGHLEGIETYVDLNVFNGTEKEFKELFK